MSITDRKPRPTPRERAVIAHSYGATHNPTICDACPNGGKR